MFIESMSLDFPFLIIEIVKFVPLVLKMRLNNSNLDSNNMFSRFTAIDSMKAWVRTSPQGPIYGFKLLRSGIFFGSKVASLSLCHKVQILFNSLMFTQYKRHADFWVLKCCLQKSSDRRIYQFLLSLGCIILNTCWAYLFNENWECTTCNALWLKSAWPTLMSVFVHNQFGLCNTSYGLP